MSYEKIEDIAVKLGTKVKKAAVCGAKFAGEKLDSYERKVPKVVRQTVGVGLIALGGGILSHSFSPAGRDAITMDVIGVTAGGLFVAAGAVTGSDKKERQTYVAGIKDFCRE